MSKTRKVGLLTYAERYPNATLILLPAMRKWTLGHPVATRTGVVTELFDTKEALVSELERRVRLLSEGVFPELDRDERDADEAARCDAIEAEREQLPLPFPPLDYWPGEGAAA